MSSTTMSSPGVPATSSATRLIAIPELALQCLSQLAPSKYDDTAVKTLVSCLLASRALSAIAKTDSLWVEHYRARYVRLWKDEGASGDWYKRYASRRVADLRTLSLLNMIITTPSKRGASMLEIVEIGDGAWDMLRHEATCKVPPQVKDVWAREEREWKNERWQGVWEDGEDNASSVEEEGDKREVGDDWIQRRWWAKQALGTMARKDAVRSMAEVFLGDQPEPTTLRNAKRYEEGLKALSGLMGVNVAEISRNYDTLASACARDLQSTGVCVDPQSSEFDLKAFSAGVCSWMARHGFKKAADGKYYDLMNHFPHKFMTTNRRTLPMSLVYTFVAIVTRLGLLAAPVGFPGHVHAWIALPDYDSSTNGDWEDDTPPRRLAVDVFHSDMEPFLSSSGLRQKLEELRVPESQRRALSGPAPAAEMVIRAANNILHSVTRIQHLANPPESPEMRGAALYASAMTFLIARPETADATRFIGGVISVVKAQFPLDTEPILAESLAQILDRDPHQSAGIHLRTAVAKLRQSEEVVEVKRRGGDAANVKWWVGMMFKHAKFNYVGVVLGWDQECAAGEEWIRDAAVNLLPRGRHQPFYTIIAADGSSRYVAEENVVPLPALATATEPEHRVSWDVIRLLMLVGTWIIEQTFSRVEVNEELGRAWFVPGTNTAREYPEDTDLGRDYMQSPWHRYP